MLYKAAVLKVTLQNSKYQILVVQYKRSQVDCAAH